MRGFDFICGLFLEVAGPGIWHTSILHFDVASLLIKRGINVNQQHLFDGSTPLIVACIAGNVEARTVKLLLDNGADPFLKDVNGKTALDYATQYSSEFPDRADTHDYDEKVALLTEAIRKKMIAEQPDPGQPATQPADKVPSNAQPSTPTSKDAPR